jgi:hypothetical protein
VGHRSSRLLVSVLSLVLLALVIAIGLATFSRNAPPGRFNSAVPVGLLEQEWDRIRRSYAEVRWQYLPGFRLTQDKRAALRNLLLEHALLEKHWWDRDSGTVVFASDLSDSDYMPEVDGVSFEMVGQQEFIDRLHELGRLEYVDVFLPTSSFETPTSIRASVVRSIRITRKLRRSGERGCEARISFRCRRDWGEWRCEIDGAGGYQNRNTCDGPIRPAHR